MAQKRKSLVTVELETKIKELAAVTRELSKRETEIRNSEKQLSDLHRQTRFSMEALRRRESVVN